MTIILKTPVVISPDGGKEGFPVVKEDAGKYFFVPKMCKPLRGFSMHASLSGGCHLHQPDALY